MRIARRVLKVSHLAALVLMLIIASSSASDLRGVRTTIDEFLKANVAAECDSIGRCSGGLVARYEDCPKTPDREEFLEGYEVVPIDNTSDAILISTGMCNGGNTFGQYFAVSTDRGVEVVTEFGIGDMSFIAQEISTSNGVVELYGVIWMPGDPHCCPSKQGTLRYDPKTKMHKFTGLKDTQ